MNERKKIFSSQQDLASAAGYELELHGEISRLRLAMRLCKCLLHPWRIQASAESLLPTIYLDC